MLIKICGITNIEDALLAIQGQTDWLGFIFTNSPRQISPNDAAKLCTKLPSSIKKVGVFVNEPRDNVVEIAEKCQLDYIQLHGNESQKYCSQLPLPVIKAFRIGQPEDLASIDNYPDVAYILIDRPLGKKQFIWSLYPEARTHTKLPLLLAGGLNPENLNEALKYCPDGIDVASGIEAYPGKKDEQLLSTFLKTARSQSQSSC